MYFKFGVDSFIWAENFSEKDLWVIEKAKELLLCGMGASEVAMQTGFADPAYFAKIFKQEMGITPSRYREYHHAE